MELWLIRHAKTQGNREGRYVGRTDEPILPEEFQKIDQLRKKLPDANKNPTEIRVLTSPLQRTKQTAERLFPEMEPHEISGFSECDFGRFEYRNYQELAQEPYYQKWIDSGGALPFPKGESLLRFQNRTRKAFEDVLKELYAKRIRIAVFVVHGGTIMSIMSQLFEKSYFSWQVKNLEGFCCRLSDDGRAVSYRIIE